jgi:hypothetical protein
MFIIKKHHHLSLLEFDDNQLLFVRLHVSNQMIFIVYPNVVIVSMPFALMKHKLWKLFIECVGLNTNTTSKLKTCIKGKKA